MLADLAYGPHSDVALGQHMAGLQTIDPVTQMQLSIADLLRAADEAVNPIAGVVGGGYGLSPAPGDKAAHSPR